MERRGRYLIDAPLQLSIAAPLLGIPLIVGIAYVAAVYWLPGETALNAMTVEETRRLSLQASVVYFGIAVVGLGAFAVYLTHRIVGPAQVIERAVRALVRGDYEQRVELRPGDHLTTLAAAVAELREHLLEQEESRRRLVEQLASRLAQHDAQAARELLSKLEPALPASAVKDVEG